MTSYSTPRVAGYEPAWCDSLYESRDIFEAVNKATSIVPVGEFPWFRLSRGRDATSKLLADDPAVAERVLQRIDAEGPMSVMNFERVHGAHTDWFGAPQNVVRALFEALTAEGVLGLAYREDNLRFYDRLERLLPDDIVSVDVPLRERLRHRMLSRYRAHGLLGAGGGGGAFAIISPAASTPQRPGRRELQRDLVEDGSLVPVDVEGVRGRRFVLAEELDLLREAPEPTASVAFLPPFDALLWDKPFVHRLFGFEYVWEGFFPPAKRRWGRYTLPIVFGDRFVGRIEPRIERERDEVEILGAWWEEGFDPEHADGFVDAIVDALAAYVRFAGVHHLEWGPHLPVEERLLEVPDRTG